MKRAPDPSRGENPAEVLPELARVLAEQGRVALCTVVRVEGSTPARPGWRLLAAPDGSRKGNLGGGAFEAMVLAEATERLEGSTPVPELKRYYLTEEATRGEATGMVCGGMVEVFLEVLEEAPVLVICGGGPVGQALARAGALAGFELLVADDRREYCDPELFPPETLLAKVDRDFEPDFLAPVRGRSLFVAVVSRCWQSDVGAIAAVLRQDPPRLAYLGLMGSRRKIERVRGEVEELGVSLEGKTLHAPIGLPIGGTTPGELAIAIVAEMLQLRQKEER